VSIDITTASVKLFHPRHKERQLTIIESILKFSLEGGDLPIHLACYTGNAPPDILRALLDAYPDSLRMPNKMGRDPLELASINYHLDHPHRAEVLFLLRWYCPGRSSSNTFDENGDDSIQHDTTLIDGETLLPADIFSQSPPEQLYMTSTVCVACMEKPSNIAILPCGHICLCRECVCSTRVLRCGKCPVGRCEVIGLYRLEEADNHEVPMMHSQEEILCSSDEAVNREMQQCEEKHGRIMEIAC
jgi:hypothetical protein